MWKYKCKLHNCQDHDGKPLIWEYFNNSKNNTNPHKSHMDNENYNEAHSGLSPLPGRTRSSASPRHSHAAQHTAGRFPNLAPFSNLRNLRPLIFGPFYGLLVMLSSQRVRSHPAAQSRSPTKKSAPNRRGRVSWSIEKCLKLGTQKDPSLAVSHVPTLIPQVEMEKVCFVFQTSNGQAGCWMYTICNTNLQNVQTAPPNSEMPSTSYFYHDEARKTIGDQTSESSPALPLTTTNVGSCSC